MARQEEIEKELAKLAPRIKEAQDTLDALYAMRLELWMEGQHTVEPRMSQSRLAAASSVPGRKLTEGAVTQALRKVRIRAEA